jgi:hypothetical protein
MTRYEPNALIEAYGVDVTPHMEDTGITVPMVSPRDYTTGITIGRPYLALGDERVEVWDYW